MGRRGSSRGNPDQKPFHPAAPLTANMNVECHPANHPKLSTHEAFSHEDPLFSEGINEDREPEVEDGLESDDCEIYAMEDEMDLGGNIDPMADNHHVAPVMDESDSDNDSSTNSNSHSGYDSEESVDAYELQGDNDDDKPQTPATSLPAPLAAATGKRDSTSATTSTHNTTASSRTAPNPRARGFAKGGRAIGTTLDAVDTTIFSMKAAGHGDKGIATLLRDKGLATYDPKTISTRYRRLREAKMAETDAALRTRRRRWSAEEDAVLMDAHAHALRRQEREMARLRARLFTDVAFCVAERLPGAFYSAEACEGRYGELSSGAAVTERDFGDPEFERAEGRRRLMAVWEADLERAQREAREWEDGVLKELVAAEKERRAEMKAKRGGTVREALAKRGPVKRGRAKRSRAKTAETDSE
ncbi:exodeoxyribonuclease vii large subunit [Diplodia corticola]|uniref:Exodeoxyribonuclease vii large subunit n=1 Tax=Diplodia corticola TaxID=236234 RepID=A0A1J9RIS6_9PEZI|nr:exodeoxyribonuclease vii large subunit [Diplodia corticola]OJD39930.1 exodeoxyribonuclease vii large subunit [Diplodia corticola]